MVSVGCLTNEVLCHFLTANNFSISPSQVYPHPPTLHSFPQGFSTFSHFGLQKIEGYGQCRTFLKLVRQGKGNQKKYENRPRSMHMRSKLYLAEPWELWTVSALNITLYHRVIYKSKATTLSTWPMPPTEQETSILLRYFSFYVTAYHILLLFSINCCQIENLTDSNKSQSKKFSIKGVSDKKHVIGVG